MADHTRTMNDTTTLVQAVEDYSAEVARARALA